MVGLHRMFMRLSALVILPLLLVAMPGVAQPTTNKLARDDKSAQPASSLTSAQATAIAIRLANEKSDALFHHRPFQDGRPAQFLMGKWLWTDGCGVALLDYHASVTLAADGSTNSVDIQVLDDMERPNLFRRAPGYPARPVFPPHSLP